MTIKAGGYLLGNLNFERLEANTAQRFTVKTLKIPLWLAGRFKLLVQWLSPRRRDSVPAPVVARVRSSGMSCHADPSLWQAYRLHIGILSCGPAAKQRLERALCSTAAFCPRARSAVAGSRD